MGRAEEMMGYPSVLGVLAAFFGFIAMLAVGLKVFLPEPPPKGGVAESKPKVSFAEFHNKRVKKNLRQPETVYGQQQRRNA
jgi:hypothetical protein